MLKALLLTAVLFAALPARADSDVVLPAIADVTGVAASDVLNVRAEPNADSVVLSELAPTATGIEIVGFDPSGAWARVSAGEASGWVSGRFLRLRTDTWQPGALPDTLVCVGTEPFWSLRRTAQGAELSTPENRRALDLRVVLDRGIAQEPTRALIAGDADELRVWERALNGLLDVGLIREKSFAVAERLAALRIPFAFVTGYGADARLPAAFASKPRLAKPYSTDALQALLLEAFTRC